MRTIPIAMLLALPLAGCGDGSSPKAAAAAVSDALVDADLPLTRGHLVSLRFLRAQAARKGPGDTRQIDLTFRARVEDDAQPQP